MEKDIVKAVQQRLSDLGWYAGPVDGIAGANTVKAMVEFNVATGGSNGNVVGVSVLQSLFDDNAKQKKVYSGVLSPEVKYPWMEYAKKLIGTKETNGPGSNPVIVGWAKSLGVASVYTSDSVSWCGLFVGHIIKTTLKDHLPKNPLGARQYLTFGEKTTPGYGAVLVFWRGSPSGWQGHVGFYVGEDDAYFYVLGGNQSDSVCVTKIAKSRLIEARAPSSFPFKSRVVRYSNNSKPSTNEA